MTGAISRGTAIFGKIIRPARLHVRIGPPLHFPEVYDRPADREALTAVARQITDAIRSLLPPEMR